MGKQGCEKGRAFGGACGALEIRLRGLPDPPLGGVGGPEGKVGWSSERAGEARSEDPKGVVVGEDWLQYDKSWGHGASEHSFVFVG